MKSRIHNNMQERVIYKSNSKSGSRELDKSLQEKKYNNMPNIVHLIVGGLTQ